MKKKNLDTQVLNAIKDSHENKEFATALVCALDKIANGKPKVDYVKWATPVIFILTVMGGLIAWRAQVNSSVNSLNTQIQANTLEFKEALEKQRMSSDRKFEQIMQQGS